jgi:TRAP transporter TAXI family solute receptor
VWLHGLVRGIAILFATAIALAALAGCSSQDEQPIAARELEIATGNQLGVFDAYGEGLAVAIERHVPHLTATTRRTDGSVQNLRRLASGDAQLAFTLADSAADAHTGRGRFPEPVAIRALARLYDNYVQVIVRAETDIERLSDLGGRRHRLSLGAERSGTAVIAERVLAVSGLEGARSPRRLYLDLEESAQALRAGEIDAFFWSGGLPTEAITELLKTVPIRLLGLRGVAAKLRERHRHSEVYTQARVPRRVYDLPAAVTTVSVPNLLVVREDLPEETAYRITRLLFERREELGAVHDEARKLNERSGRATFPIPLHRGASRWYAR